MIDNNLFNKIHEKVKKKTKADDFTLIVHYIDRLETRFAQNAITQNISGNNFFVTLETVFGNKKGMINVNQVDDNSIDFLVEKAESLAKFNDPDPEYVPSSSYFDNYPNVNNYSTNTENLSLEEITKNIKKIVKNAEDKNLMASGFSTKNIYKLFLSTKNGVNCFDEFSYYELSTTIKKDDIETKITNSYKDYNKFNINDFIEKINSQFSSLTKPKKIEAGKIPVILRPIAAFNLFQFLCFDFEERATDDGLTPYTGYLGKEFFGKNFTLESRNDIDDIICKKFIYDGIPTKNVCWIKNGIIENFYNTKYYAKVKNKEPIYPYNIIIHGDNYSEDDMIKKVDKGLIINSLWYLRYVDRKKGEITGMTRDGVLYFENGKILHSVNNLRFNEIPWDVTKRILALGKQEIINATNLIPTVLIDNFNFVDTTTF